MDSIGKRLKWAREQKGYASAAEAARAIGVKVPTYTHHENGTRGVKLPEAHRYARFYGVSENWLLTGEGAPTKRLSVPVLGYVGGGAEVITVDDYPMDDPHGDIVDRVELPMARHADIIALRVRGNSMWPAYSENDLIFYDRAPLPPAECLGREAVIRLADGRTFVKRLAKGSRPGFFTLISYNGPPIEDVEVEWAVPVRWVERR